MSLPRVGPFAIMERRVRPRRSLAVIAITPEGHRTAVQVPFSLSGPAGLTAALTARQTAPRGRQGRR